MKTRKRPKLNAKEGDIVQVRCGEQRHVYAQFLPRGLVAFYEWAGPKLESTDEVASLPVAFFGVSFSESFEDLDSAIVGARAFPAERLPTLLRWARPDHDEIRQWSLGEGSHCIVAKIDDMDGLPEDIVYTAEDYVDQVLHVVDGRLWPRIRIFRASEK